MITKLNLKVSLLALILAASTAFAQQATIEVMGTSTKEIKPQKISVEAYIQNREGSSKKAEDKTSDMMEKVLAYIEMSSGAGNARVTSVKVKPRWNSINEEYEYISMQYVSFEIDSLLAYEDILEDIMGKGISGIADIKYMIKNQEEEKNKLMGDAYRNAQKKAQSLAIQMEMKLGKAVMVKEMMGDQHNKDYISIDSNLLSDMLLPSKVVMTSTVTVTFALN